MLGLALQNSVGQIISGLLMLFEQPFRLGDWLDTPSARGRVVEVNWRAVHIDTGSGLQITPNSVLAGASFTNLSRPPGSHKITIETTFSRGRSAGRRLRAAGGHRRSPAACRRRRPTARRFRWATTTIARRSRCAAPPTAVPRARRSLRWLWYAARRAEYHLDGCDDDFSTPERTHRALQKIARSLRLTPADQRDLVDEVRLSRYGADERIQQPGSRSEQMKFVVAGQVELIATAEDGTP